MVLNTLEKPYDQEMTDISLAAMPIGLALTGRSLPSGDDATPIAYDPQTQTAASLEEAAALLMVPTTFHTQHAGQTDHDQ